MRFSLRSLLLATAFAAIALAGHMLALKVVMYEIHSSGLIPTGDNNSMLYGTWLRTMPRALWMWMPLLFVAFAAGRRKLDVPLLLAFVVCEVGAIGLMQVMFWLDGN